MSGSQCYTRFSEAELSVFVNTVLFVPFMNEDKKLLDVCTAQEGWKYLILVLIGFLIGRERIEDGAGRAVTSYFRQRQGSSRA